jgi:hypothetical protein
MAGKIIADIIEAPYDKITLNVGNTVVASMNASGLYTSTGNLLITQANQIGTAALPAGTVLQVVQGNSSVSTTTTSASFVDTGLSATITPTSATSKILVIVSHPATGVQNATSAGNRVYLRLLRDSTAIQGMSNLIAYNNDNQRATETVTTAYLDSPSTTSAITYKTQFKNDGGSETVIVNWNASDQTPNSESTITLMEIAA